VVNLSILEWILRLATAGALIGHGTYGAFMQKSRWYGFFDGLGIGATTVDDRSLMIWTGGFQMALGPIALVAPSRSRSPTRCRWASVRCPPSSSAPSSGMPTGRAGDPPGRGWSTARCPAGSWAPR
jgi:hypothetical protein